MLCDEVDAGTWCGVPCSGNSFEFCGGHQALNIYSVSPEMTPATVYMPSDEECRVKPCLCPETPLYTFSPEMSNDEKLAVIMQTDITAFNLHDIISDVIELVEQDVSSQGIAATAHVLENVAALQSQTPEVTAGVVKIIDSLINVDKDELVDAQRENGSTSRAMKTLEDQLCIVNLTSGDGTFKAVRPNVAVQVQKAPLESLAAGMKFVALSTNSSANLAVDDIVVLEDTSQVNETLKSDVENAISIRIEPLESANLSSVDYPASEHCRVVFSVMKSTMFGASSLEKDDESLTESVIPNTHIISITIKDTWERNFTTYVRSVFKRLQEGGKGTNISDPVCVFWDFNAADGRGNWSDFGCELVSANDDSILICECNHTTNFAVIMNFRRRENSTRVPSEIKVDIVLSYVGCALSVTSLVLTMIIYGFSPKLRQKQPNQILLSISASLLFLYLTFFVVATLYEIDQVTSFWSCILAAALLHYFVLTSLTWMGVEGVNMYLLFVRVINFEIPRFMMKASLIAWGVPALVVITTGAVARRDYVAKDVCVLAKSYMIGSLLVPVGIIMLVNLVIFIIVIARLSQTMAAKTANREKALREQVRRVQNAVCLFLLMGLTWSFGFLLLIEAFNRVFQIIFITLNSFQGFLIFLLYCLRQPTVRETLGACCVCWSHRFSPSARSQGRTSEWGDSHGNVTRDTSTLGMSSRRH
ncbi:adhesion G-protein coupled receptor G6-like [Diadema antillarum]|uniref:adhesion G-protein coupled receptor G6-like n=1 Tax=Diadema antillarum TaxID=105358 RepID=UPI003A8B5FD8